MNGLKMNGLRYTAAVALGWSLWATAAQAEAPGVYYSWRALDTDVNQCLERANQALTSQALVDVQIEGNSVAGRTENATAVFVCLEENQATTVMVIVAGNNDEAALNLRETLKMAF
jgi:hypothetical protein